MKNKILHKSAGIALIILVLMLFGCSEKRYGNIEKAKQTPALRCISSKAEKEIREPTLRNELPNNGTFVRTTADSTQLTVEMLRHAKSENAFSGSAIQITSPQLPVDTGTTAKEPAKKKQAEVLGGVGFYVSIAHICFQIGIGIVAFIFLIIAALSMSWNTVASLVIGLEIIGFISLLVALAALVLCILALKKEKEYSFSKVKKIQFAIGAFLNSLMVVYLVYIMYLLATGIL